MRFSRLVASLAAPVALIGLGGIASPASAQSTDCRQAIGYSRWCSSDFGTYVQKVWSYNGSSYIRFKNVTRHPRSYTYYGVAGKRMSRKVGRGAVATLHVAIPAGNSKTNLAATYDSVTSSAGVFGVSRGTSKPLVTSRHLPTWTNGVARVCVRNPWAKSAVLNMATRSSGHPFVYNIYKDVKPGSTACVSKNLPYAGERLAVLVQLANASRSMDVETWVGMRRQS